MSKTHKHILYAAILATSGIVLAGNVIKLPSLALAALNNVFVADNDEGTIKEVSVKVNGHPQTFTIQYSDEQFLTYQIVNGRKKTITLEQFAEALTSDPNFDHEAFCINFLEKNLPVMMNLFDDTPGNEYFYDSNANRFLTARFRDAFGLSNDLIFHLRAAAWYKVNGDREQLASEGIPFDAEKHLSKRIPKEVRRSPEYLSRNR